MSAAAGTSGGRVVRWTAAASFYTVLTGFFAFYAAQAFHLEWNTTAGRIGPGFFPRIIGVLGVALGAAALARSVLRPPSAPPDEDGAEGEPGSGAGRYLAPLLAMLVTFPILAAVLMPLGAVLTSALVLAVLLGHLNRGHLVANAVLTVAVPVGMYAGFDLLLDAGLPAGLLPLP